MEDLETYILSAVFFIILCAIFFFWKKRKDKSAGSLKKNYVLETLELAHAQYEVFTIKLSGEGNRAGFSGLIDELSTSQITLDVTGALPEDCHGKAANVFFHARRPEGPIFYTFDSVIREAKSDFDNSRVILTMPDHLRVEKKRHFARVKPNKNDIRVIGVWPIQPGKRLPRSTSEIGPPSTHYKPGMTQDPVYIENISGAGLALRLITSNTNDSLNITKGSQLLCLVVYVMNDDDKPIAFWCTGEVMNIRPSNSSKSEVVIGLEFTNWAVLEQVSNEIHWAHSSPSRGAKPMLQWVENIEKKSST